MSKRLRLRSCHNIAQLIKTTNSVRVASVYWEQFCRMAERMNDESPAG